MKKYVKPTIDAVELRLEERVACCKNSSHLENSVISRKNCHCPSKS